MTDDGASAVPGAMVMCQTCSGRGFVQRPFTTAVPGVMDRVAAQRSACPDCRVSDAGSSGRFRLQTGPGARLRPVDRIALPGDLPGLRS